MSDQVTDLRQFSISRVTLGLILSVASVSSIVTWNSARLVSRLDRLEATVQTIQENTNGGPHDLADVWLAIDELRGDG